MQRNGHNKISIDIAVLILDLGARRGWLVSTTPRPLYPWERPGTHCIGCWMGPSAGLDVCEKSRPHRDFVFYPWTVQPVASRYADWATRPPVVLLHNSLIRKHLKAVQLFFSVSGIMTTFFFVYIFISRCVLHICLPRASWFDHSDNIRVLYPPIYYVFLKVALFVIALKMYSSLWKEIKRFSFS
jgi:hypothetical protein